MTQGDNLVSTVLDGRYQLVQRIGEGGMGVVYRAQELATGQPVAVKVLNSHMAKDPNWVQRFYNEAKATSQLQHPNTIRMREFGQTPSGVLYLSMEFLDGQSLRDAIQKSAPMPPPRVLAILSQCCDSLSEAHRLSIIHRDIKPDNIFLQPRPRPDFVKVLDFSVAKLLSDQGFRTQAGMVFGTPEYMSPEQGRGRQLDARSDLYALGSVAYEMLTGRVPFSDPHNPMAILQAHMTAPLPPMPGSVPPPVSDLISRCMAKEPGQRYGSADEMKAHCDAVLGQLGFQAPPPAVAAAAVRYPTPNPARAGVKPGFGSAQKTMLASAQSAPAKTMMAEDLGLRGRTPPPVGGPPPPVGRPPPPVQARPADRTTRAPELSRPAVPSAQGTPHGGSGAAAKTMIAGNVSDVFGSGGPPALGGHGPAAGPPSMPPQHAQQQRQQGPNKTVMLNPSDGVVSFNQGPVPVQSPPVHHSGGGASVGFWILCLGIGLAIGVGAYFVVAMTAGGS